MAAWIALILLMFAGLALVVHHDSGTIAGLDAADFSGLVAGLAIIIFIGWPMLSGYRRRMGTALRDMSVWVGMALVLVALYSFRGEFMTVAQRVTGELLPPGTVLSVSDRRAEGEAVRIRRRLDGHFEVKAQIEATRISLIVDTGASTVVLRQEDARRAGIDLSSLIYSVPVQTANGDTFAARVRLPAISVGPVAVTRVEALVAKPGALHQSLLGMSFLSRLRSYEFSGDFLTLRS